jgi:hypothetical protein
VAQSGTDGDAALVMLDDLVPANHGCRVIDAFVPPDYQQAAAHPLAEAAPGILAHMNADLCSRLLLSFGQTQLLLI